VIILSLFDGMSSGRIALDRVGISVIEYYASEIDKYAQIISEKNYPDIIRLGDVKGVRGCDLPKIDLLLAGSPCQGFSFAGKQLAFNDPRSALFFEFVRILRETKPKYFLLENVKMKKEYQDIISEAVGVEPIEINSALLSAQNRRRLYWTNIPNVSQPKDKGIILKSIIESGETDRAKAYCLDANYFKGTNLKQYLTKCRRQIVFKEKSGCLLATIYKENAKSMLKRGKHGFLVSDLEAAKWRKLTPVECERLQTVPDNYTEGVSNTQRYKMLGNGWTVDVIAHILKGLL
jgi:site-specific DNA-cytosine methylase